MNRGSTRAEMNRVNHGICKRSNAYCIIHLEIHCDEEKNSVRLKKWCLDIFYDTVTQYHFLWNSMFYIYLKRSWSNSLISVFYFSTIKSTGTVPVFGPETLRTHFFESFFPEVSLKSTVYDIPLFKYSLYRVKIETVKSESPQIVKITDDQRKSYKREYRSRVPLSLNNFLWRIHCTPGKICTPKSEIGLSVQASQNSANESNVNLDHIDAHSVFY